MTVRKLFGGKPATSPSGGTTIRITNPWHAVSVQCGTGVCEAAKRIQNVRYLSAQAPKLPLADCANPGGCRCVYRHHDDRRAGPRRSIERGSPLRTGSLYPGNERRRSGGRRRTD